MGSGSGTEASRIVRPSESPATASDLPLLPMRSVVAPETCDQPSYLGGPSTFSLRLAQLRFHSSYLWLAMRSDGAALSDRAVLLGLQSLQILAAFLCSLHCFFSVHVGSHQSRPEENSSSNVRASNTAIFTCAPLDSPGFLDRCGKLLAVQISITRHAGFKNLRRCARGSQHDWNQYRANQKHFLNEHHLPSYRPRLAD